MGNKYNLSSSLDRVKQPLITQKSSQLFEKNQYTFLVNPKLTKPIIKKVIEYLFNVKIIKINTCNLPMKKKRVGKYLGMRPRYKKIIVKLSKESTIDFFSSDSIVIN